MSYLDYVVAGLCAVFKPEKSQHCPKQVNVELNTTCNLRCRTCVHAVRRIPPQMLSYSRFCQIVDRLKPNLIASAGLGEPLLHPDLFKMVAYARTACGAKFSITSNGTLLQEHAEGIVHSGLHMVNLSLDSADRSTYLRIRGKDLFDKIQSGITSINECKRRFGSVRPQLGFHFVIQNQNYREIPDFVRFAKANDIAFTTFIPLQVHDDESYEELASGMTQEEVLRQLKLGFREARTSHLKTNLEIVIRDWNHLWLKYRLDRPRPISRRPCLRPWISAYVNVNGEVTPCCNLTFGKSKIVLGNMFHEDFMDIWNNRRSIAFRKLIRSGRKSVPVCDSCVPLKLVDKLKTFSARSMLK